MSGDSGAASENGQKKDDWRLRLLRRLPVLGPVVQELEARLQHTTTALVRTAQDLRHRRGDSERLDREVLRLQLEATGYQIKAEEASRVVDGLTQVADELEGELREREAELRRVKEDEWNGAIRKDALAHVGGNAILGAVSLGTPMAIGISDIDYFKSVNTEHGHDPVDKAVILPLVRLLKKSARVGRDRQIRDYVFSFGGEEFVTLYFNVASPDQLRKVLNRSRDLVFRTDFKAPGNGGLIEPAPPPGATYTDPDGKPVEAKTYGRLTLSVGGYIFNPLEDLKARAEYELGERLNEILSEREGFDVTKVDERRRELIFNDWVRAELHALADAHSGRPEVLEEQLGHYLETQIARADERLSWAKVERNSVEVFKVDEDELRAKHPETYIAEQEELERFRQQIREAARDLKTSPESYMTPGQEEAYWREEELRFGSRIDTRVKFEDETTAFAQIENYDDSVYVHIQVHEGYLAERDAEHVCTLTEGYEGKRTYLLFSENEVGTLAKGEVELEEKNIYLFAEPEG